MRRFFLCPVVTVFLFLLAAASQPDLVSLYKTGSVVCRPDPSFGADVDWVSLFLDSHRQVKAAPDGSVFVSNQRDHSISKFGPDGTLLKTFGKKGRGPGDLEMPGKMSILDKRFLVVGDRLPNRRISLFNLDGSFHKMLKTQHSPGFPEALSGNKVAYVGSLSRPPERADSIIYRLLNKVIIKDVDTGEEREVVEFVTSINPIKDGTVIIARTGAGELLVGMTLKPELGIYDLAGNKTGSITLDIEPLKVTDRIREHHQMKYAYIKDGVSHKAKGPMREFLPYYRDLCVDGSGNIIVFLMTENPKAGPFPFQVYSPEGRLICRSELDTAEFAFAPDMRFDKFDFTEKGIYCILHKQEDELETPRLMRIKVR